MSKRPLALLVLAGSAAVLSACGDDPPNLKSIRTAGDTITKIAGGASAAVTPQYLNSRLAEAVKNLTSSDSKDPLASAAASLKSASQLGQFALPASKIELLESKARGLMSLLTSAGGAWSNYNAMAAAARIDTAPRQSEIQAKRTEIETKIQEARTQQTAAESAQKKLRDQAEAFKKEADKAELKYVELKESTRSMTLAQAAPILEQALTFKQSADESTLKAGRASADALLFEPRKVSAEQAIAEHKQHDDALKKEADRLTERAKAAKAAEQQALAAAQEVAALIDKSTKELMAIRDGELTPAFNDAVAATQAAKSSAQSSTGDGLGGLAAAQAGFLMGELLTAQAREADAFAAVLRNLVKDDPQLPNMSKLPNAAALSDAANAAATAAGAAREKAVQAYTEAVGKFNGVSAKGESLDKIKATLIARLNAAAGIKPEAPADDNSGNGDKPAETNPAADASNPAKPDGEKPAEPKDKPAEEPKDPK